jgi:hypothetical protein
MRNILVLLIASLMLGSCVGTSKALKSKANIDPVLVGIWTGSESENERPGLEKHWVQHRLDNGTLILLFLSYEYGEIYPLVRKGTWWVEDGVFYEKFDISGGTDSYAYVMITKNMVRFKAKKLSVAGANPEYTFIETRVE